MAERHQAGEEIAAGQELETALAEDGELAEQQNGGDQVVDRDRRLIGRDEGVDVEKRLLGERHADREDAERNREDRERQAALPGSRRQDR